MLAADGGSILELLGEHESLAYEQIAVRLDQPPAAVRAGLERLRELGMVASLGVGRPEGSVTGAVSCWQLTDGGREELARRPAA